MIGVLVITHGNLGSELIKAAEMIKGKLTGVIPISIDSEKGVEDIKKEINGAIKKVDTGDGILIMTDLFGGTPSNISLSFMKEGKVEVVTGVNLPMLLKLEARKEKSLSELSYFIKDYGRKNISLASEILKRDITSK
jgi:PTS system mannose-specific IIA component